MSPAHIEAPALNWFGWTDRGKVRKNNEDSFLGLRFDSRETHRLGRIGTASLAKADFAFAVSDGMGEAKLANTPSNIAVEKITTLLPRSFGQRAIGLEAGFDDVLTELFAQVHRALAYLGLSYEECQGMETTLSLCWFTPGWMYFGHIGDSRIYYLSKRAGTIKQISHDDTYVGWMYRNGQINEREARTHPRRNVLQKSLGGSNQFVDPQIGAVGFESGDQFLICSDGLTEGLYNHHILDLLHSTPVGPEYNPARQLVLEAVKNDGRDNTTALVIQVA